MGLLEDRRETYLTTVRGMCRTCRRIVPARVVLRDGKVWQRSLCETCACTEAMIASDAEWYLQNAMQALPDRAPIHGAKPPVHGCPHDCGPCAWHASPCQLPVVSITNACNLDCPICFTYNRPDRIYHMSVGEMQATVEAVVQSSAPVDLINITGGEPTLHPQLIELLRCCKRPEIGRITMNSNGLRLARDPGLCERLAELEVYVILSLHTFDPATSIRLHGRDIVQDKLRAIENLTRAGVRMTLLQVMERGVDEDVAGRILELMQGNDLILSHTVQTMTYTGQGGGRWAERRHIPVDEAASIVAAQSRGALRRADFLPRPSAHPLCYLTCYLVKVDQKLLPFARFASPERIMRLMQDSYLIRLDADPGFFQEVVQELYAKGETEHLRTFRQVIEKLYPSRGPQPTAFERQRMAESLVRTVYVHTHMDEDNFDCSRAMMCPDLVPCEPGKLVPACTYNLFYRQQDERFYVVGRGPKP